MEPSVDVEKSTNGVDADTRETGPALTPGDSVTWTYIVTNTGDVALIDLAVTDDVEGPICVLTLLLPGESTTCTLVGVVGEAGYRNVATVEGTPAAPIDPDGDLEDPDNYDPISSSTVDDEDPSNYTTVVVLDSSDPIPAPPVTDPDVLPSTGSAGVARLLIVGFGLLVSGAVLALGARRRRGAEMA